MSTELLAQRELVQRERPVTLPDLVTLGGLSLGLWWALGGPAWAGIASVVADEVDGRIARAAGAETEHGAQLDWGADVALTPLVLLRLSRELGVGDRLVLAVPVVLAVQARLRAEGWRPVVGSFRAFCMLLAIAAGATRGGR